MHTLKISVVDPVDRARRILVREGQGGPGRTPAPAADVPAPHRRGAVRPAPPVVGRGRRVRHREPRAPHQRCRAGRRPRARRRSAPTSPASRSTAAVRCGSSGSSRGSRTATSASSPRSTTASPTAWPRPRCWPGSCSPIPTRPPNRSPPPPRPWKRRVASRRGPCSSSTRCAPDSSVCSTSPAYCAAPSAGVRAAARAPQRADVSPPAPFDAPNTLVQRRAEPQPHLRHDDDGARRREGDQDRRSASP